MAIGLCNSMWVSHHPTERMYTSIIKPRFLLLLHQSYNQHLSLTHSVDTSYLQSVCSSTNTYLSLSPSISFMTSSLIGYISSYSLSISYSISTSISYYHLDTYSCFSVCGNSLLLASIHPMTLSSHWLYLHLTKTSLALLDHHHLKIDSLGHYTCIAILISASTPVSSTPISLSSIIITYLSRPCDNRVMDIGCISLSSSIGLVRIKVAIIL